MSHLDWLRYFPFARDRGSAPKATEVRGPYLRKPRAYRWRFGDVNVHYNAPRANPIFGFDGNGRSVEGKSPGHGNILTSIKNEDVFGSSNSPQSNWHHQLL